jgi:hypothetical protein
MESEPEIVQPSDLPPINTPDGELAGYNVLMSDDDLPAPKKRVKAQVIEDEPPALEGIGIEEPAPVPRRNSNRSLDPARVWTDEDDDSKPYGMNAAEGKEPERQRLPESLLKPRADEMALLDRSDAPKPPKRVWEPSLLAFLGQPGTVSALTVLSAIGIAAGVLVRVARLFDPTAGDTAN